MNKGDFLTSARKSLAGQFRELKYVLPILGLAGFALLGFIWLLSVKFDIEYVNFTRDLSSIAKVHPLYGLISTLGIVLWTSGAAVCLFVYFVYRKEMAKGSRRFLLFTGLLTFWLLLDDAFEIHEFMAPFHLHIQQEIIYGIYILMILGYLVFFFRSILETESLLFFLACLLIGASVGLDFLVDFFGMELPPVIEDILKFFGLGAWFLYCIRISAGSVRSLTKGGS